VTNAIFARDNAVFRRACSLAGVPPTKRQASKFRGDRGRAFAKKAAAVRLVEARR